MYLDRPEDFEPIVESFCLSYDAGPQVRFCLSRPPLDISIPEPGKPMSPMDPVKIPVLVYELVRSSWGRYHYKYSHFED